MDEHYYPFKGSGISLKFISENKQLMRWRDGNGESRRETLKMSWDAAVKTVEAALIRNRKYKRSEQTFDDLVDKYLRHVSYKKSFTSMKKVVNLLLKEFTGLPLSEFTTLMIEQYQVKLREKGNSPATIKKNTTYLKMMFKCASRWKLCSRDVFHDVQDVEQPKVRNERDRWLTRDEESKLFPELSASQNKEIYYQAKIAINTGMRLMEIVNLTWDRVDMQRKEIKVIDTKNGENRIVPINQACYEVFREISKVRRIDGRLFQGFGRIAWNKALQRAKITNFRFHDLRHTFASWLIQDGCEPIVVQKILGHKTMEMTGRYSHLSKQQTKDAVALLDRKECAPLCSNLKS